jgi:hypothetical protein
MDEKAFHPFLYPPSQSSAALFWMRRAEEALQRMEKKWEKCVEKYVWTAEWRRIEERGNGHGHGAMDLTENIGWTIITNRELTVCEDMRSVRENKYSINIDNNLGIGSKRLAWETGGNNAETGR